MDYEALQDYYEEKFMNSQGPGEVLAETEDGVTSIVASGGAIWVKSFRCYEYYEDTPEMREELIEELRQVIEEAAEYKASRAESCGV